MLYCALILLGISTAMLAGLAINSTIVKDKLWIEYDCFMGAFQL
jgi:hypothetical protein